jgi:hypothetical protein
MLALTSAAGLAAGAPAQDDAPPANPQWAERIEDARKFVAGRRGHVGFAVVDEEGNLHGHNAAAHFESASVVKAMLMVAYLNDPGVRDRPLTQADRELLDPMIRWSDNVAATRVRDMVGNEALERLAQRVGMKRFSTAVIWGSTQITAADQAKLFLKIDRYVVKRHRPVAMHLLSTVVRAQRWGVGRVRPRSWALYFKGGWGDGSGAVDHQVALLRRGRRRVAVAILTTGNPSHEYGKETLRGVARLLLRGLGPRSVPR